MWIYFAPQLLTHLTISLRTNHFPYSRGTQQWLMVPPWNVLKVIFHTHNMEYPKSFLTHNFLNDHVSQYFVTITDMGPRPNVHFFVKPSASVTTSQYLKSIFTNYMMQHYLAKATVWSQLTGCLHICPVSCILQISGEIQEIGITHKKKILAAS